MRTLRTLAGASPLVLVTASLLAAQQSAPPRRQPAPGGQASQLDQVSGPPHEMMMGGAPAGHLLQLKEHLKLTDEQVKRLETLNTSQMVALAPNPGAHLRAQADMADAMQGEGNLVAARAAMEKMAKLRTDGAIAHMQAMRDARALLTADQKAQIDAMHTMMMRGGMHGMHGMHGMRGGMPGQPGPRGQRPPQGQRPPEGQER